MTTTAEERYRTDPYFHSLVVCIERWIARGEFTPSEIREACIIAATNYEMRTIRPMSIRNDPDAETHQE